MYAPSRLLLAPLPLADPVFAVIQWMMANEGYRWVFRALTGQFLAPAGQPNDGVPLVGRATSFAWDIYPDPDDESLFKCALHPSIHPV